MKFTPEFIQAALRYEPETGILRWRKSGRVAGWRDKAGYVYVRVGGKHSQLIGAHRLAWVLMTGRWPEGVIDHRNRQPSDNRWSNLRETTQRLNLANSGVRSHSRSQVKGVDQLPGGRFRAGIKRDGKRVHLGVFDTPEQAHAAYMAAAVQQYGEFACGGR